MNKKTLFGIAILRFAFIAVFAWFGASQISNPGQWISLIPSFIAGITPGAAHTFVLINGWTEIVFALLLALDVFTPVVALLGGLHLVGIAIDVGLTSIGVRDIGLSLSLFALATQTWASWGEMFNWRRRTSGATIAQTY